MVRTKGALRSNSMGAREALRWMPEAARSSGAAIGAASVSLPRDGLRGCRHPRGVSLAG